MKTLDWQQKNQLFKKIHKFKLSTDDNLSSQDLRY